MAEWKKKPAQSKTPPELLLWEVKLELDTHLSFDECISHIQQWNDYQSVEFGPKLKIAVSAADENSVLFNMHIGKGLVRSWIIADLEYTNGGTTLAIGRAGVDPSIIILFGLLTLIPLTLLITTQSFVAFLIGVAITVIIIFALYFSAKTMRGNLIHNFEEMLQ